MISVGLRQLAFSWKEQKSKPGLFSLEVAALTGCWFCFRWIIHWFSLDLLIKSTKLRYHSQNFEIEWFRHYPDWALSSHKYPKPILGNFKQSNTLAVMASRSHIENSPAAPKSTLKGILNFPVLLQNFMSGFIFIVWYRRWGELVWLLMFALSTGMSANDVQIMKTRQKPQTGHNLICGNLIRWWNNTSSRIANDERGQETEEIGGKKKMK